MNKKLKEVKELIKEIDYYTKALDVLNNYDSEVTITISSCHNNNTHKNISIAIPYKIKSKTELEEELLSIVSELENKANSLLKEGNS